MVTVVQSVEYVMMAEVNWTHSIESLPQISPVMASWLLEEVPLPPSISIIPSLVLSPPFLPSTLPFCHVCRGTYRVAAGFLFSGNVLDD